MESLKSRAACVCLLLALAGSSGCIVSRPSEARRPAQAWCTGSKARCARRWAIRSARSTTRRWQVLKNMGVGIVADKTEAFNGEIESALRGGSNVRVNLKAVSSTATEVTIRVGTFGDRDQSDMVLNAIEARLGDTRP